MPHTVNGIGTWYWGKRNVFARRDTCEFCGRATTLTSYDTTLYFVLIYLPVIPIKRKRVIGECAICHRHRVLDLAEWNAGRDREIAQAMDAFEREPTNVEAAKKALGTAVAYEDETAYFGLAELVESHLPHDAEVQAAMGAGLRFFGKHEAAETAYRHSLQLRDDPKVRRTLAVLLMCDGRPDDAVALVSDVLAGHQQADLGLCYLLVESFQFKGRHAEALALLDEWAAGLPGLEQDKEFNRYRKLSQKHQTSGVAVSSVNISKTPGSGTRQSSLLTGWFARWFAPAAIVIALLGYLFACYYIGEHRTVYVVNGLDVPYSVTVGGQTVMLPANHYRTIEVAEGELKVSVSEPERHIEPATVRISSPFLSRVFSSRVFVINPDQTSMILWEKSWYAAEDSDGKPSEGKVYVGSNEYEFTGIDYVFEPLPESLRLESKRDVVGKTRVGLWEEDLPVNAVGVVEHYSDADGATQFIERKLRYEPENRRSVLWLKLLLDRLGDEQFVAFCKPLLADRPVRINIHRSYQSMQERLHPDYDIEAEYRKYCAAEPGDMTLKYLLARETEDHAEQIRLFTEAATGPQPCAMAANALAWEAMMNADFARAEQYAMKANQIQPHDYLIENMCIETQFALGHYSQLLKYLDTIQGNYTHDTTVLAHRMTGLAMAGRTAEAQHAADEMRQFYRKEFGEEAGVFGDAVVNTKLSYAMGNAAEFINTARQTKLPDLVLMAEVTAGSWATAATMLDQSPKADWADHMLLAAGALATGQQSLADSQIEKAAAMLKDGGREERRLAQWLTGSQPVDVEEALRFTMLPEQKRVALTLLGLKYPQEKQRLFERARKMNFMPSYPKLTLDELLR